MKSSSRSSATASCCCPVLTGVTCCTSSTSFNGAAEAGLVHTQANKKPQEAVKRQSGFFKITSDSINPLCIKLFNDLQILWRQHKVVGIGLKLLPEPAALLLRPSLPQAPLSPSAPLPLCPSHSLLGLPVLHLLPAKHFSSSVKWASTLSPQISHT